jgi:hypothetical protein
MLKMTPPPLLPTLVIPPPPCFLCTTGNLDSIMVSQLPTIVGGGGAFFCVDYCDLFLLYILYSLDFAS